MSNTVQLLQDDLTDDVLADFTRSDRIAWDIETDALDWRQGRIGTCQLHSQTAGTVLVQVDPDHRPERLAGLLADEAVLKIFHHAPFDLRWMMSHWQVQAASVGCTKVASRLLDPDPNSASHSLKHLLKQRLGINLDKGQRLSDWTRQTLTPEQVAYASSDVVHLLPLLDLLEKDLVNGGRLETYQRCVDYLPTRALLEINDWPDVFSY